MRVAFPDEEFFLLVDALEILAFNLILHALPLERLALKCFDSTFFNLHFLFRVEVFSLMFVPHAEIFVESLMVCEMVQHQIGVDWSWWWWLYLR